MTQNEYLRNLMRLRSGVALDGAASIATGQVFLQSELTKFDANVRMPMGVATSYRDIPMPTGGGWMDYEAAHNLDFRGPQEGRTGTRSNDVPVLEYNMGQDTWPTQAYQVKVRVPLVESLKMAQLNRSPQDMLRKAVRVHFEKTLDIRVYKGEDGQTGLINNTTVTAQSAPTTGTSSSSAWEDKTAEAIFEDFNKFSRTAWENSGGDPSAIPDRYLVPSTVFTQLQRPMAVNTTPVAMPLVEYIKKYGFAASFGITPEIFPLPTWLETAGSGSSTRLVAYRYDQDCLSFSILQDLSPYGGPLALEDGAFQTMYVANTGVVKINRFNTINYWDGI